MNKFCTYEEVVEGAVFRTEDGSLHYKGHYGPIEMECGTTRGMLPASTPVEIVDMEVRYFRDIPDDSPFVVGGVLYFKYHGMAYSVDDNNCSVQFPYYTEVLWLPSIQLDALVIRNTYSQLDFVVPKDCVKEYLYGVKRADPSTLTDLLCNLLDADIPFSVSSNLINLLIEAVDRRISDYCYSGNDSVALYSVLYSIITVLNNLHDDLKDKSITFMDGNIMFDSKFLSVDELDW